MFRLRLPTVPLGLVGFDGETSIGHVAVLAGSAVAFAVGYIGAAVVFFGGPSVLAPAADPSAAPAARRVAGVFGSLACWGFFAGAFVRGRGGPVLDAIAYPVGIVTVVPTIVRWVLFGFDPGSVLARLGVGLGVPVGLLVDAAALVVPGVVFFASLLAVWASRLSEVDRDRWARTHLDPEFYEAFVETRAETDAPNPESR